MKGLILSGGKGTRLQPLTYNRAKQLFPVANTPVLFRVIESMRQAGITDVGVVVGKDERGEEIQRALDNRDLGVKWQPIWQLSPDGLAHAVKISQEFIGDDRFAMMLGDNVIQGGISDLIQDFASSDWNSQIVLKEVDDPRSFGVAALREDGSIDYLVEKPPEPPSNLALVGIYMFDHHVFEAVNSIPPSKRGEYEITDAIQWLIKHGYQVYPHIHRGWWIDTGKPMDMLAANDYVLEELRPCIAPDAVIENSEVDHRVTVEAGAQIINSIIRGPSIIGERTVVKNAYIGPFTSIYHDAIIENSEIEHSIVLEHTQVLDIDARLQESLIGRNVKIMKESRIPRRARALKMNLADQSTVWIPS